MKTVLRRKKERKTSYKKRLGMLKSGKARVVIRKTNKYVIVQLVESRGAQDKVVFSISSKELLKHGWPKELGGSLKSVSAAYLTGYLAGKKIKVDRAILDLGLQRSFYGGRLYAALKGLVDAGVKIEHDKKIFPSEERISGKHLKENVQKAFESVRGKLK